MNWERQVGYCELVRSKTVASLWHWASTVVELSWQHVATIDVRRIASRGKNCTIQSRFKIAYRSSQNFQSYNAGLFVNNH